MRRFAFASVMLLGLTTSLQLFAQGAVQYKTLNEVKAADFYRLTCSDVQSVIHAHVFLTIEKQKVTVVKIVTVEPALSLQTIDYSNADAAQLFVQAGPNEIIYSGERTGAYWNETLDINLRQENGQLLAKVVYDDGDGMSLDRDMVCGATNFLLSPRQ